MEDLDRYYRRISAERKKGMRGSYKLLREEKKPKRRPETGSVKKKIALTKGEGNVASG